MNSRLAVTASRSVFRLVSTIHAIGKNSSSAAPHPSTVVSTRRPT